MTEGDLVAAGSFGMRAHQDGDELPLGGNAGDERAVAFIRRLHAVGDEGWLDEIGVEFPDHRGGGCRHRLQLQRGQLGPVLRHGAPILEIAI